MRKKEQKESKNAKSKRGGRRRKEEETFFFPPKQNKKKFSRKKTRFRPRHSDEKKTKRAILKQRSSTHAPHAKRARFLLRREINAKRRTQTGRRERAKECFCYSSSTSSSTSLDCVPCSVDREISVCHSSDRGTSVQSLFPNLTKRHLFFYSVG